MKKTLLIILIATLFVITACGGPDVATDTKVIEEDFDDSPDVQEEDTLDVPDIDDAADEEVVVPEVVSGQGNLFIGDSVTIAGTKITLVSVSNDGEVVLNFNGKDYSIFGTKRSEIVDGLLLEVTKFNYDYTQEDNIYVQLSAEPWAPATNEYLFMVGEIIDVEGISVRLQEVAKETFPVRVEVNREGLEGLKLDTPKEIEGLELTLVKASPRIHQLESYALIKIVPAE